MDCVVCKTPMDPALAPEVSHPSCSGTTFWLDTDGPDPLDALLKQELTKMILWAEFESPRSKQVEIGPSEMGGPCNRRIAYKLAGVPHINTAFDPWPAVVGTSVHAWLEKAVAAYQVAHGAESWLTEIELDIFGIVKGHSDLYSAEHRCVIDWKTAGPDVMKKVRVEGPPESYVTQAQLYGLGFAQLGLQVDRVALAFLPRSGWLRDMYVWSAPYDEAAAAAAMLRLLEIYQQIVDLDPSIHPHRWEQFAATSGDHCGHCPWFNSLILQEEGASQKGCPGIGN